MKRLFWKEYRENRMVPIWFAILLGLLMTAARMTMDMPSDASVLLLYTSWSLAGVFTAAGAISREVGNGTLAFLLAQPVSRRAVWWVKWLSGLGILAASIIATSLAWAAVQHGLYGPDAWDMQTRQNLGDWAAWAALASVSCYAVAWSVSALLDRAISVAMLSLVVCGAIVIPITLINGHYQAVPGDDTANIILFGFACFPAFACASYAAFSRGEAMRNRRRLLWAAAGWLGGLIAAGIIFLALCSFVNRFHSRGAYINELQLSNNGRYLLLTALNVGPRTGDDGVEVFDYRGKRLVVESVNGPAFNRILPSGWPITWSPDGRYLLYEKDGALFGLVHTHPSPACVDVRTAREIRLDLPKGFTRVPADIVAGAWSPDGKWLALQVTVQASLERSRIVFYRRADIPSDGALWRPWSSVTLHDFMISSGSEDQTIPTLYFRGVPAAAVYSGDVWEHIAWSGDSRCLYTLDARTFAVASPGERAGGQAAIAPLFVLPHHIQGLALQMSRDDRHILISYPDPPTTVRWHAFGDFNKNQASAVVDLAAATAAAQSHSSRQTPDLNEWIRRWSSAAVPPGWRAWPLAMSPNGRFLIQQHEIPHHLRDRRIFSTTAQDLSTRALYAWDSGRSDLPAPEDWLADGHRLLNRGQGGKDVVVDVLTGKKETIALQSRSILCKLPGDRLLLANLNSPDVLHIETSVVEVK